MVSSYGPPDPPIRAACWKGDELLGNALLSWDLGNDGPNLYDLRVTLPSGEAIRRQGPELFECLFQLRRLSLDPRDIKLAVNGARLNAWASGMLREQGGGL